MQRERTTLVPVGSASHGTKLHCCVCRIGVPSPNGRQLNHFFGNNSSYTAFDSAWYCRQAIIVVCSSRRPHRPCDPTQTQTFGTAGTVLQQPKDAPFVQTCCEENKMPHVLRNPPRTNGFNVHCHSSKENNRASSRVDASPGSPLQHESRERQTVPFDVASSN